ncbi:allantoinase, mitochondrial isoform X2 [Bacillus rossius redtenbacheri]|uniref:allantoinase, mitochondrial isoform X2 n=1 Tax=Bacillus rossius redtenbacheri TaxID=93214 RepID=UPI002FDD1097
MLYRGRRVVLDTGVQEAGILVDGHGRIQSVLTGEQLRAFEGPQEDVGDLVLMAGLVDSHVHVNEPGRASWEGFLTATAAAAKGGVTTIVDMPLNSIPPTTTVANLRAKLEAARDQIHVDVAFWGGVVPDNKSELRPLVKAGVVGFKCFLCPSGVDEFPHVDAAQVEEALVELEGTGSILAFHAELCGDQKTDEITGDGRRYSTFLKSRPASMELAAVQLVTRLCRQHSVPCHIVHLSAAEALPLVRAAKQDGARLTAETCHHYLTLAAEDIPRGATQYKCCPPERLWTALADGLLDMVVSDHSPCTPDLKLLPPAGGGDFLAAWGGVSSLQLGLSLFWTQARGRGFSLQDASRLLSAAPARLCGLDRRKGRLAEGMDADMVVWDPDRSFQVSESELQHKNKVNPYTGRELYGVVVKTILQGRPVYEAGADKAAGSRQGKLLLDVNCR